MTRRNVNLLFDEEEVRELVCWFLFWSSESNCPNNQQRLTKPNAQEAISKSIQVFNQETLSPYLSRNLGQPILQSTDNTTIRDLAKVLVAFWVDYYDKAVKWTRKSVKQVKERAQALAAQALRLTLNAIGCPTETEEEEDVLLTALLEALDQQPDALIERLENRLSTLPSSRQSIWNWLNGLLGGS